MQRIALEDVVLLALGLSDLPSDLRRDRCLEIFERRHLRHKVSKRLGGAAAQGITIPDLPPADHRMFTSGLDNDGVESLICILSALCEWRRIQVIRGRAGAKSQDLPAGGKLPTTPGQHGLEHVRWSRSRKT